MPTRPFRPPSLFAVNLRRVVLIALILAALGHALGAEESTSGGWSADLLNRILKAEPAKTESTEAATSAPEMVLRTYNLNHLRVGEAGKAQNVLAILERLLPPGSTVNTDVPANSLHILTTPAAQKAVWDYLSAVDVSEPAAAPPVSTVPEDVKIALKKLAEAGDQSAKLLSAVGALKSDMTTELAQIEARQRQASIRMALVAGGFAILLTGTILWMLRRRSAAIASATAESTALALAPEQLTNALTPVHDKMRTDMLGLLNEVAIKLQAQHTEQQKLVREQQQQLEDARLALAEERRQFITEAGSMVVQAVERVDATTAKLAKQQDKVAELVQELQNTVRELDETKDDLRHKEVELEQERAKIAALSILLEEGGAPMPPNGHRNNVAETNGRNVPITVPAAPIERTGKPLCTNSDPVSEPTVMAPRFQFLPPDHPES